jgi:opacity protein-like surface antigen
MNRFVLGMMSAVWLVAPAGAADIPVKAAAPAAAVWSWTGCYVGAHGGWQTARIEPTYGPGLFPFLAGLKISEDLRISGLSLGPTLGCNYQLGGNWVVGVEADYDFVHKSDERVETLFQVFRVRVQQEGLLTVRGRIGYAVAQGFIIPLPTLYYVTGGGIWARMETSNFVPGSAIGAVSQTETYTGWTVGFGSEYAVGGGWSVKSETLYARMGNQSNFPSSVVLATFEIEPRNIWISRIGINYRFNVARN